MAMVVHLKEQEVGENLLGNRVPNLIRNDSHVSFLLPCLTSQLHVEGLIVQEHVVVNHDFVDMKEKRVTV